MNRKLIITIIKNVIWTVVLENDVIVELQCSNESTKEHYELGDIYVGKVKNIVKNINAAFVEIANGVECYYSMSENPNPIFTKKIGKKPLCIGDELLVQISKEAVKTKAITVTSKLNFTGKYAILTVGDTRIGISAKLGKEERERLQNLANVYTNERFGLILRTNARDVDDETITSEIESLISQYEALVDVAHTRTCFSCVKKVQKQYLAELRNIYQDGLTEIIVEDSTLFDEIKTYLKEHQPEDLDKLRKYEDKLLPLHKCYNLEKQIENACKERVWLKSGAYLVIQPTEALTVIDVNTGKCVTKKKEDETYLNINLEAAKEAARQIRLRNLSGIVLVDFMNLDKQELTEKLLEVFRHELKKDPITTTLVDVTKLHLVEVTRKKIRKPLHEVIREMNQLQTKEEDQ